VGKKERGSFEAAWCSTQAGSGATALSWTSGPGGMVAGRNMGAEAALGHCQEEGDRQGTGLASTGWAVMVGCCARKEKEKRGKWAG
jgi:hypothetical protein